VEESVGGDSPLRFARDLYRAQPIAAEDRASGLGLGLAVCKLLVEAQGGHIRAAKRDGGGSVFSFTLPLS
jgi:two-component system sensor histidine kinase KdpD